MFVLAAVIAAYYSTYTAPVKSVVTAPAAEHPTPSPKKPTPTPIKPKQTSKQKWILGDYIRQTIDRIKPKPKPKPKSITQKERVQMEAKNDPLERRMEATGAKYGDEVFIRVFKDEKLLELWIRPASDDQYHLLKIYDICTYSGSLGPKLREGDRQSPEGFYKVYKSSLNPHSKFTLSFNLGYPNRYDRAHGRTGSYLMVHGKCASIGCYAMGDDNIRQIYRLVHDALYGGQRYVGAHIFPFRMEHLDDHAGNKWYTFWQNLKEGYDLFEESKIPPRVKVKGKEYRFE